MPSLEKHIQLSLKKSGKKHQKLHTWLDGGAIPFIKRIRRHIRIRATYRKIQRNFGKGAAKEYFLHLRDDYNQNSIFRLIFRQCIVNDWRRKS